MGERSVRRALAVVVFAGLGAACASPDGSDAADGGEGTATQDGSGDTATGSESGDDGPGPAVCCGCLCVDPAWSCSPSTCVDAEGRAVELVREAGFIELEAVEARRDGAGYTTRPARMWYAFAPADVDPRDKPLIVFFNGGPGVATMSGLFAMNTGAQAVDAEGSLVGGPATWTSFANLLHVDARGTGFSYELGPNGGDAHFNAEQDAADFIRVTIRFVARHPQLRDPPIVMVGESYGGQRATLIARLLDRRVELRDGLAPTFFADPALAAELDQHDAVARRFGEYVAIQGHIVSRDQTEQAVADAGGWPPCASYDPYACHSPEGHLERRFEAAAQALVDPAVLAEATGVDVVGIEWMHAAYRADSITIPSAFAPDDTAMQEVFGPLPGRRRYFTRQAVRGFDLDPYFFGDEGGRAFLEVLPRSRWFMTNAAHDQVVFAAAIPIVLGSDYPDLVTGVGYAPGDPGLARPGWAVVDFVDGTSRDIRFPAYGESGHAVSAFEPVALHDDVRDWLASVF